ncbi:amino acid adenylation domain-containing protein [Pedobacter sp.]|uniref:amino acid adenylation domain-containing protein n=1 Tax=Pedobacter sp. TaxID=1411316 RepID=UPI003BA9DB5B
MAEPTINDDEYSSELLVHRLFESVVKKDENSTAVIFDSKSITYRELNNQADQLAAYLVEIAKTDSLIAVSTVRSLEMVVSILAILKSGKSYLPLDPTYPEDRLKQIIEDSGVKFCLSLSKEVEIFESLGLSVIESDKRYPSVEYFVNNQSINACVLYTSGSTGKPKGVCLGHVGLVNFLNWQYTHTISGPKTRALQFCHLSFDASFQEIFVPLTSGGTLYLVTDDYRLDGSKLLKFISENQINKAFFPYVTLQYFVEAAVKENTFPLNLQEVITGGELLKITPAIRKFFNSVPNSCLINVYGPTETTIWVSTLTLSGNADEWPSIPTIGKSVANASIFILNSEYQIVNEGEFGEIHIGGISLANGYLNQPDLTKDKFIEWKNLDGNIIRLYKTGDIARYLQSGEIEFGSRKDNQVKIRGNRVELGEIEVVITQQNEISQSVVILREDIPGIKTLCAYIVGNKLLYDGHKLRNIISSKLPDYMIPTSFIWLDEFPKTTSGKVDRKSLPQPDYNRPEVKTTYRKPSTTIEKEITNVLLEIFGYNKIGIDDNFFEIGGTSLLAQKTVAELRYQLGYNLPVTKLYQTPTISGIAKFLDNNLKSKLVKKSSQTNNTSKAIAIIGMEGKFPGAKNIDKLWDILLQGKETTSFFTDIELDSSIPDNIKNDSSYVKARGVIEDYDKFDAAFFGINPKLAELSDPQQRIFLEVSYALLESTGHLPSKYTEKIGVYAGCGSNTYYENNVLPNPQLIENQGKMQVLTVNEKDYIATRTAYHLNLNGPAVSVNSACSTSLLAIAEAVTSLRTGQCSVAIAGGASITAPVNSGHIYQEGSILSADGHCKPFDNDATGTVFSDGVAAVLLKRLDDAINDGDKIFAVIKGVGVNNDGAGKGSFTAPSADGQANAIETAILDAGISADEISYVEAHGTGTPIGDPIEFEGLVDAFGIQENKQFCAIGSIKSNFGHLTQAAGVAGIIKTTLSLHNKKIPASIGFNSPNKLIDFANSPFYVNDTLKDWDILSKRIAGVSSFGVGGTNVHIILEEFENPVAEFSDAEPFTLIPLSAETSKSLKEYSSALAEHLSINKTSNLDDISHTLINSREDFKYRRHIVAKTTEEAIKLLNEYPESDVYQLSEITGNIVFTFPGQGAQYLNMGLELYKQLPVYKSAIDECAEILRNYIDRDIREIIFPDAVSDITNEQLRDTRWTQPALFVTEYAMAKVWLSLGIEPNALCGHSIGEYVAAHLSGIFSLEDGLKLISTRGTLISNLPKGSMLSVRETVESVEKFLTEDLSIAAVNSKKLIVVAGPTEQIEKLSKKLDEQEIANKVLFTSHAFHSAMMDPVLEDFKKVVLETKLSRPKITIISSVTGQKLCDEDALDPNYWTNHLRNTIQFSKAIETILNSEPSTFLEIGPGNVNSTLIKQISIQSAIKTKALNSFTNNEEYKSFLNTLGSLWKFGLEPKLALLYKEKSRAFTKLPTYQFDRKKYWLDINKESLNLKLDSNLEINQHSTANVQIMRKNNLAAKVKQVLEDASGIEMENVEQDQNFVEIGLDSLLLTQVAISLKKEFGLPITFRKLNEEYSSINALVDYIDNNIPQDVFAENTTPINSTPAVEVQASYSSQPIYVNHNSSITSASPIGDSALSLIAQQLEILSKQVLLMQGIAPAFPTHQTNTVNTQQASVQKPVQESVKPKTADSDLSNEEKAEIQKPFGATPKIERQSTDLNPKQETFIKNLAERYNAKTIKSKNYADDSRPFMADPRVVSGFKPATKDLIYPIVINKSSGSKMWDLDGNEYIDALNGFGSNMLGYQPEFLKTAMHEQIERGYEVGPQHELASEVSKLICEFTGFDRSALCSTGSEAVLGCIRIARTVTGRSLIVAFSGSYHGIVDEVLVRGTKKLKSFPAAAGIMPEAVQNILVLDYGTDEALAIIKERADEIAAVIIEPIQSRRPEYVPLDFVKEVRKITEDSGAALVFDEVITGFRMHPGGAQALFNVRADLASYGKVVGAGIPIGVIAGKKQFMDALDGGTWQYGDSSYPEVGVTYFAGTFVRHPLALASAKASLLYLKSKGPKLQEELNERGNYIAAELNKEFEKRQLPIYVANYGSLWKVKYHEELPYSELMFTLMREKGIHILDGFPCFITEAMTYEDLDKIIASFKVSMDEMIEGGFFPPLNQVNPNFNKDAVVFDNTNPPVKGAKLGLDDAGNPAWFIESSEEVGKYLQVG